MPVRGTLEWAVVIGLAIHGGALWLEFGKSNLRSWWATGLYYRHPILLECRCCMPARIICVHCGITGFVRAEHLIEASVSVVQYYCGRCERTWTVADPERRRQPRVMGPPPILPKSRPRSRS